MCNCYFLPLHPSESHDAEHAPPLNIVLARFVLTGLRSWNVDLTVCDLNKELQLFEVKHTAQFSAQVKGQSEFLQFYRRLFCVGLSAACTHWSPAPSCGDVRVSPPIQPVCRPDDTEQIRVCFFLLTSPCLSSPHAFVSCRLYSLICRLGAEGDSKHYVLGGDMRSWGLVMGGEWSPCYRGPGSDVAAMNVSALWVTALRLQRKLFHTVTHIYNNCGTFSACCSSAGSREQLRREDASAEWRELSVRWAEL